jgi:hypothetical protein
MPPIPRPSPQPPSTSAAFENPLRQIQGLTAERIDQGVDYSGAGPVFAPGPGTITAATSSSGWPGGGYIEEQFASGFPSKYWYFAENINPTVQVGQHVDANTIIGQMYRGQFGIETGWAAGPPFQNTEAWALGQSAKGGDPGAFTTAMGVNASEMLQSLGAPAGIPQGSFVSGTVPPGYFTGSGIVTTGFPGGNLDPLNWIANLFGLSEKTGQNITGLITGAIAGAFKKGWANAWKRFQPDFIRIALILLGVLVLYAGIQGFLRPNQGPTQLLVKGASGAVKPTPKATGAKV